MKKLILSSNVLKPAIKRLGQAINNKAIIPVLKSLHCTVNGKTLEMVASDLELTISIILAIETPAKGDHSFLLPFDFIHGILEYMNTEPITIDFESKKKIIITSEKDVYETPTEDVSKFPITPSIPKKNSFAIADDFIQLLHKAMLTASKDDSRPAMMYTCLDVKAKESFLVSTDTYFMFRHKISVEAKEPEQLLFSSRMAKAIDGLTGLQVSWTEKNIGVKSDNVSVVTARVESKFPNYNAVIPSYGHNLTVNKESLAQALHKSMVANNGVARTTLLLTKEKGKIFFDAIDTERERKANVNIDADYNGPFDDITVSAKKLLTILDQVDEETVRLHIGGKTKAILFSVEENENYLGLVMPIVD